jgi:uncharacterized membrane protein (UPF0136 family)
MPWLNIVLILYVLLNIVMGVLGYVNKHSVISLVAGVGAGVIVLGSMALAKSNPRAGRITALVVSVLLIGRFAPKAFENQLYPAGIMFASSIIVAISLGAGHMMGMKAKKAREAAEGTGPYEK